MSALIKGIKLAQQASSKSPALLYTVTRNHWNKDFKPAPYPKTAEEREAAAKKYNLFPEEYRPYPDDGTGTGDYPKLPSGLGTEAKDPYYPYDFPEHKRNFHDPVHADYDLYSEDRYSLADKPRFENRFYFAGFLGCMAFCIGLYAFLENKKMFRPVIPKQLAGDGKVHYTFETK